MTKTTPAKAGDAEPKTPVGDTSKAAILRELMDAVLPPENAAETATTGATTETPTSTDQQITLIETPPTKLVPARVLTDCAFGKANSIALVPADIAEASGDLDPDEAAVAYAQLLAEKIAGQP